MARSMPTKANLALCVLPRQLTVCPLVNTSTCKCWFWSDSDEHL